MQSNDFSLKMKLKEYKNDILNSKKYCIIYLIAISIIFFSLMDLNNYAHPKWKSLFLF